MKQRGFKGFGGCGGSIDRLNSISAAALKAHPRNEFQLLNRLGKFAKVRISSRNFSNSILNQARAFWAIAITSGICANSWSRFSY
jgi:hypothetical protein